MFAYMCLACLGVYVMLIAFSYYKTNSTFNLFINHVMVYLLSTYLNFKIIYIAVYINTPENDNDGEIIRTIIYDFVSSNILAYVALDTRLSVSFSLYVLNFAAVMVAQYRSNANNHYYLDGLTNLPVNILFYLFNKAWEKSDRATFAEKYRFEKFYNYTRDFIYGMNGIYMNVSKDFSIYCDSKMKTLLNDMHIDRLTGKSRNPDKNLIINAVITEVNRNNEINSLMTINNLASNGGFGNLSVDVLNLFTLYDEKDWEKGNLNGVKDNLKEKLKVLMLGPSTTHFVSVGKFKLESFVCTKYFEVHFRKFGLTENNFVNDILIYDITDLITSRQTVYEEGIIKEKIMSKVVHEFKTPINSIIGLIGNMEDSLNSRDIQENKTTGKHLKTIRNLSNYVIFLISDIIHFTSIKSSQEVRINFQEINLKEIENFGFEILKSLLRCNKSKEEAIKPVLEFDDEIDTLLIKTDENRLKQLF